MDGNKRSAKPEKIRESDAFIWAQVDLRLTVEMMKKNVRIAKS